MTDKEELIELLESVARRMTAKEELIELLEKRSELTARLFENGTDDKLITVLFKEIAVLTEQARDVVSAHLDSLTKEK